MPVIGFLNSAWPEAWAARIAALKTGLSQAGYIEGQNFAIEYRWAKGNEDRFPELASDLAARGVTVVAATGGGHVVQAAKRATTSIPIVFTGINPVSFALLTTLNRQTETLGFGRIRCTIAETDWRSSGAMLWRTSDPSIGQGVDATESAGCANTGHFIRPQSARCRSSILVPSKIFDAALQDELAISCRAA